MLTPMKTTHIRITKESKKILKEMAKKEDKTSAEKLEEIIEGIVEAYLITNT